MAHQMKSLFRRRAAVVIVVFLLAYVSSYAFLSRRGMAQTRAAGMNGFYFFRPEDSTAWVIRNYGCVYFFYPLIVVEEWFGTVDGIGCEPTWRLSTSSPNPPK
jgi:hypothetical protein